MRDLETEDVPFRSEVLLQLRPATGHAAVTAAALHLAESGEDTQIVLKSHNQHFHRESSPFVCGMFNTFQAAEALKLVEPLAESGQTGGNKVPDFLQSNVKLLFAIQYQLVHS